MPMLEHNTDSVVTVNVPTSTVPVEINDDHPLTRESLQKQLDETHGVDTYQVMEY